MGEREGRVVANIGVSCCSTAAAISSNLVANGQLRFLFLFFCCFFLISLSF